MYLNCHSYFSLRYGTLSPKALVQYAAEMHIDTLVLTDINNTSAAYEFITHCQQQHIKPILGIEFRSAEREMLYIGIARNREGWRELNAWQSNHSLDEKPIPPVAPDFENAYIIYKRLPVGIQLLRSFEFVAIRPEEVNHLYRSYLLHHQEKLVVLSPVTFRNEDGYRVHKLLQCIDRNIILSKLPSESCARINEVFHPPGTLEAAFRIYPKILENTRAILDDCTIKIESTYLNNRRTFTGSRTGDSKLLYKLSVRG
ncbi:MAG TPA: PHP domain-containing protein, partial [Saprospiraceae bacterium]|nr:PHP domain-containing protein [Saprospiraceae bacterium]